MHGRPMLRFAYPGALCWSEFSVISLALDDVPLTSIPDEQIRAAIPDCRKRLNEAADATQGSDDLWLSRVYPGSAAHSGSSS